MQFDVFNGDADGLCALQQLRLLPPRPNPASELSQIRYFLPRAGRVAEVAVREGQAVEAGALLVVVA